MPGIYYHCIPILVAFLSHIYKGTGLVGTTDISNVLPCQLYVDVSKRNELQLQILKDGD